MLCQPTWKRLIACFVSLVLVATLSPVAAFGDELASGQPASGNASQKSTTAAKRVYKHADWIRFLGKAKNSKGIAVTNGKISAKQRKLLKKRTIKKAACGYIAINVKTGKVIAHNANMRIFGASTIKAPYIAALCKYGAPGLKRWRAKMHDVITYSNNAKYAALHARYGHSYMKRFIKKSKARLSFGGSNLYATFSPRDLAKLWATTKDYVSNGKRNVKFFKKLFGQGSLYKEGWMYAGSWCGKIYNVGGIKGDCVYAIMTRTTRPNKAVWNLRNALVKALA